MHIKSDDSGLLQGSFPMSVIYESTSAGTGQKQSYGGTRGRSKLVQGALWGTAGMWVATFLCELICWLEKI